MSNIARRFNAVFGFAATAGLVTSTEAILSFPTADAANRAVARIGAGVVAKAFTGAWLVTLSRADIEAKVVALRVAVRS